MMWFLTEKKNGVKKEIGRESETGMGTGGGAEVEVGVRNDTNEGR